MAENKRMEDASGTAGDQQEMAVMVADDARHKAMVAGDLPALGSLLDEELIYTHATARRETRQEYLQALALGRTRYLGVRRLNSSLRMYGQSALMIGESEIHVLAGGLERTVQNMFQSVWICREGLWKMTAWTSVLMPTRQEQRPS
jgi:hypothetical protein